MTAPFTKIFPPDKIGSLLTQKPRWPARWGILLRWVVAEFSAVLTP